MEVDDDQVVAAAGTPDASAGAEIVGPADAAPVVSAADGRSHASEAPVPVHQPPSATSSSTGSGLTGALAIARQLLSQLYSLPASEPFQKPPALSGWYSPPGPNLILGEGAPHLDELKQRIDSGQVRRVSEAIDYMRQVCLNALKYFQKDSNASNFCRQKAISLLNRVDDQMGLSLDLQQAYAADSEGNRPWVKYSDPSQSFPEIADCKAAVEEFLKDAPAAVHSFFYAIELYYVPPALPADYLDTIRAGNPQAEPEWLGRVIERLYYGGHYKSAGDVDADVKRVFENAIVYWQAQGAKGIKETSSEAAMKLAGLFGKIFDKHMAKAAKRLRLPVPSVVSACSALDLTAVAAKARAARPVFPTQQQKQQKTTAGGGEGAASGADDGGGIGSGLLAGVFDSDSAPGASSSSSSSSGNAPAALSSSSSSVSASSGAGAAAVASRAKRATNTAAGSSVLSRSTGAGIGGLSASGGPSMSAEHASKCLRVIDRLDKFTFTSPSTGVSISVCQYFRDPVSKELAPDYDDVIQRPMWLNEVRRKLASGEYPSPLELKQDVELIVSNCLQYNPAEISDNADIRFLANKLRDTFWRYYGEAFPYEDFAANANSNSVVAAAAAPAPPSSQAAHAGSSKSWGSSSSSHNPRPRSSSPPPLPSEDDGGMLQLSDLGITTNLMTGATTTNNNLGASGLGQSGLGQTKLKLKLKTSSVNPNSSSAASSSSSSSSSSAAGGADGAGTYPNAAAAAFSQQAAMAGMSAGAAGAFAAMAAAAASGSFVSAVPAGPAPPAPSIDKVLPPLLQMMGSGLNKKDAEKVAKVFSAVQAEAAAKPAREKQLETIVERMFEPQTLEDLRLAPPNYQGPKPSHVPAMFQHNYPSYEKALAEEAPRVFERRTGTLNAFHKVLGHLKRHDWFNLFEGRWIELNKQVYSQYPEAVHQAIGLGDVLDKFRQQLPRKQQQAAAAAGTGLGSSTGPGGKAGGGAGGPPKAVPSFSSASGGAVKDAYLNVGEIVADIHKVLDIAIKIHSPPAWHGPPLVGRDVAKKAEHLKRFIDYWADEYCADSVLPLLPRREGNRTAIHNHVCSRNITADTKDLLNKLHKKLLKPGGDLSKLQRFFLAPANEIWPSLSADYYAVVKQPMDLRTVGDKLKFKKYVTHGEVYEDIRRIWGNAMLYNQGGKNKNSEEVFRAANRMDQEFSIIWAEASLDLWDKLVCTDVKEEAQAARDENRRKEDEELQRIKASQELEIHSQKASEVLAKVFEELRAGGGINPTILPPGEQLLSNILQAAYNSSQKATQYESEVTSLQASVPKLDGLERGFAAHVHGFTRSLLGTLKADSMLVDSAIKMRQQEEERRAKAQQKLLEEAQQRRARELAVAEAARQKAAAEAAEAKMMMATDGDDQGAQAAAPGAGAAGGQSLSGHKRSRQAAGLMAVDDTEEDAAFVMAPGSDGFGHAPGGSVTSHSHGAFAATAAHKPTSTPLAAFEVVAVPAQQKKAAGGSIALLKGKTGLPGNSQLKAAAVFAE